LIALARRYPTIRLFGLDAAEVMLATARANAARAGLADRIQLAQGLAQDLDPGALFALDSAFDAIVISYALTMIPEWRATVHRALLHLKPGGVLAVVDFWDQRDLPAWFGRMLRAWLRLFDVNPRADMPDYLADRARAKGAHGALTPVMGGYAFRFTY